MYSSINLALLVSIGKLVIGCLFRNKQRHNICVSATKLVELLGHYVRIEVTRVERNAFICQLESPK